MKSILLNLLLASWNCKDFTLLQINLPLRITGVALTVDDEYYDDYGGSGDYVGSGDHDYREKSNKKDFLDGMRKKLGMISWLKKDFFLHLRNVLTVNLS